MITPLHARGYTSSDFINGEYKRVTRRKTLLTKRFCGEERIPADTPKEFTLGKSVEPDSLEQLLAILLELETDVQTLIVRQAFLPKFTLGDSVRRLGENVVVDTKSRVIAIDVDDLLRPTDIGALDVLAQGEYVVSLLHEQFPDIIPLDVGFIAQASSSAGTGNGIKLHMWFMNADAVTQSQCKSFFLKVKGDLVDLSLYDVVHPYYTAAPVFSDGAVNPFNGVSRSTHRVGSELRISKEQPEYVRPIKVSTEEATQFLSFIDGSLKLDKKTKFALERLREWDYNLGGARHKAVLPLYHNAIQGQINLELVDREATAILEKIRPGCSEDYIRQGKIAALSYIKACSNRTVPLSYRGLQIASLSGGTDPLFLSVNPESIPSNGLVFLKASLGTGKTTFAKQYMKGREARFVGITDTVALVESLGKSFNAGDYRKRDDLDDFKYGKIDRIVGTLHSLHKLSELDTSIDVVFIDEADSVMNTLLFASIIDEPRRERIRYAMSHLLRQAKLVIVSDGDLSEETVGAYIDLIEGSKPLYRIVHNRPRLTGVKVYKHMTEASLMGGLFTSVEINDGPVLLTTDQGPTDLNVMYNTLKNRFPDKNIEVIHAESTKDPIVKDIFARTIESLRENKIDVLLCSPSVTNGVDFNGYFHTTFVATHTMNHTPNMRFQAMMRERSPKEIHYYFKDSREFDTGYGRGEVIEDGWMPIYRKKFATRKEREYRTYIATFNYYLIQSGARIEVVDDPYENPISAEDESNYILERANAILQATEWSCAPRHNDAYEYQRMVKFLYDMEELDDLDFIIKVIKAKPDKRMEYLHKLSKDYWNILITKDPKAVKAAVDRDPCKFYLLTQQSLKATSAMQVLKSCGISEGTDIEGLRLLYIRWCTFVGVDVPKVVLGKDVPEPILEL